MSIVRTSIPSRLQVVNVGMKPFQARHRRDANPRRFGRFAGDARSFAKCWVTGDNLSTLTRAVASRQMKIFVAGYMSVVEGKVLHVTTMRSL